MNVKRLAEMALLTAVALIIFIIELRIPALVPIPGVKLGLANIITVYAIFRLGPRDTLLILIARILLGAAFAGSVMSLLFSAAGGLLCWLVMLFMRRIVTQKQIWVCSIAGAAAHNTGQMLVTAAVYRTVGLFIYFPALLLAGIAAGLFTGICAQLLVGRLRLGER
ncbi:MAG: Gx transporter family protein [Oscillospiraceae bacterium]|nr:Gx transporter family protein [Oscillospiraceae bacterium]